MFKNTVIFTTLIGLLMTAGTAKAQVEVFDQRFYNHEFSVYAMGGSFSPTYTLEEGGKVSTDIGAGAGLSYTFYFNAEVGISTGVEFSRMSSTASYNSLSETYTTIDPLDSRYTATYTYSIARYNERQNFIITSIPLLLQANVLVSEKLTIYGQLGAKLALPTVAQASITAENIVSSGYFSREGLVYEDLPDHDIFNGQSVKNVKSKIDANPAAMLHLESGVRFGKKTNTLYFGIYFDYSVTDMKKTSDKHPLNYAEKITYESVLNSPFTYDLSVMCVGLKLKWSMFR